MEKRIKLNINRFSTSVEENIDIKINADLKIEGTNRKLKDVDESLTHLIDIHNAQCDIGGLYETTDSAADPNTFLSGTWTLLSSNVIDTGWQDFSWTNSTYIGTTQSSFTLNK